MAGRVSPFRVTIDPELCTLCQKCLKACPVYAIDKEGVEHHAINSYCNRCGDCFDACPSGAIDYTVLGYKPSANGSRILFLISAWLVGGAVSLLFVPAALLRILHSLGLFFGG
jgi:Fe-S-cluster-containing hydrogenase component 2